MIKFVAGLIGVTGIAMLFISTNLATLIGVVLVAGAVLLLGARND